MRVSRQQANQNRAAVVGAAARLFRERGFDGIGIAELMKETGLTHGGFYKQFGSKAELMVEASEQALAENRARLAGTEDAPPDLARIIAGYLSAGHRDAPASGCAFAALAAEAARGTPALQHTFAEGLRRHCDLLAPALLAPDDEARQAQMLLVLSTMVGALLIARAVGPGTLSDQILDTAAADLRARFIPAPGGNHGDR